MKILLVDDLALVREGLRRILSAEIPGATLGAAASGPDAVDRLRLERWDIVLLDLWLPGRGELEALKEFRLVGRRARVLVMTTYDDDEYAVRAFRAGAAGYLTKGSSPDELIAAVHKVASGGKYVSAAMGEKLATTLSGDSHGGPRHARLSDRELEVLRMFGRGMSVNEISAALALSAKTVSTYRTRILTKMGMRTTAQLVHYALNAGLVPRAGSRAKEVYP